MRNKLILVPRFSQVDFYKTLYLNKGGCLLGTSFTTLSSWVEELWILHGDGRSKISSLGLELACFSLLRKQDELFGSCEIPVSLGSAQGLAGFYRQVVGLPTFQRAIEEPPSFLCAQEVRVLEIARLLDDELEKRELCLPGHQSAVLSKLDDVDIVFEGNHDFTPVESWFLRQMGAILPERESFCLEALPSDKKAAFLYANGPEAKPRLIADYVSRCVENGHRKVLVLSKNANTLFDALLPFADAMRASLSLQSSDKLAYSKIAVMLQAVADVLEGGASSASVSTIVRSPYSGLSREQSCAVDNKFRSDRAKALHSEEFLSEHVPNFPLLSAIAKQGLSADAAQSLAALARGIFADSAPIQQNELLAIQGLLDVFEAAQGYVSDTFLALAFAGERVLPKEYEYANANSVAALVVAPYARVLDYVPDSFDAVIVAESDNVNFSSGAARSAFDLLADKLGIECEDASVTAQRALIQHAISCARASFASCYCQKTSSGEDCYPAFFLEELAAHYQQGKTISLGELSIGDESDALVMSNDESRLIHNMLDENEDSKLASEAVKCPQDQSSFVRLGEHEVWPSPKSSLLKSEEGFAVSASGIECYLSCPRKWFLERCIKADPADEEFGNREQGSFVHSVLKRFFEELDEPRKQNIVEKPEEAKVLLSRIFDEELEAQKSLKSARYLPIKPYELVEVNKLKDTLLSNIELQSELLENYEPRYFEFRINLADKLKYGGVAFQGSVDRIDVDEAGKRYAVIDYKGSINDHEAGFNPEKLDISDALSDLDSIDLPKKVQALIYAQALRPYFDTRGLRPNAALYLSYRDSDPKSLVRGSYSATLNVSAPSSSAVYCDFTLYLDLIERSLTPYIESMNAGKVSADPCGNPCRYCPDISCPKKVG